MPDLPVTPVLPGVAAATAAAARGRLGGVDHVQLPLPVGGSAVARRFYEGALGLAEVRHPALDQPGTLRFALGTQRLDLREGAVVLIAPQAHLAVRVADLAALVVRLRHHGHPVDESLRAEGRAYTEDPFGNRLELVADVDDAIPEEVIDVRHVRFAS